ncbi:hypothetical protein [Ulvibacterium marinum]|uniref:Competence protein n=1 Tax=Ulvibacterium marinum TaxID=2419782 RepID=A0A3B0BRW3_9FLAO|nr:hypothetical protein [Ulvibacterium marinum]RKN75134.1 hypothetical protein D7Z94_25380 [Ulvibacterium marinum]
MSVFESLNDTSNKAVDVGEQYYKKTQEYYKLKIFQQLAMVMGRFCKIALIGGLFFISLIIMAVAGILALGRLMENTILACLVIGLFFLILGGLVYRFRTKIDNFIVQKLSTDFFE